MPPPTSITVASHQINPSCHACMSLGSRHVACHHINQSKLPAIKLNQSKLPCMNVTRIDASMSLGSRHAACHHINQSKLPAIQSIHDAMHVCHSDRCKQVARIEACSSMPPPKSIQVASHQINPSCHACMSLGSRHVACHHINQSKLPAIKSIQVAMHACHSDRYKHVTRIDS
jgi:hypothetical protein